MLSLFRKSHQRCSLTKCVLRNFAKFTGKHQCLFFNKVAGLWATVSIFLLFNGLFVMTLVKRYWLKYLDLIYANNDSNAIEKNDIKNCYLSRFFSFISLSFGQRNFASYGSLHVSLSLTTEVSHQRLKMLHKICGNTGFYWPVFSLIFTHFMQWLVGEKEINVQDRLPYPWRTSFDQRKE